VLLILHAGAKQFILEVISGEGNGGQKERWLKRDLFSSRLPLRNLVLGHRRKFCYWGKTFTS
jgi:hypothetical protein